MGRLTDTPELRTTSNGTEVTSFSLAVDRGYAKQGEERQTDFINCVAWRQRAGFITKYFVKGQLIAVEGSLQTRQYQDKNGNNRTAYDVVIDNAYFTGDKRGSTPGAGSYNSRPAAKEEPQTPPAYSNGSNEDFEEMPLDDDLPF